MPVDDHVPPTETHLLCMYQHIVLTDRSVNGVLEDEDKEEKYGVGKGSDEGEKEDCEVEEEGGEVEEEGGEGEKEEERESGEGGGRQHQFLSRGALQEDGVGAVSDFSHSYNIHVLSACIMISLLTQSA